LEIDLTQAMNLVGDKPSVLNIGCEQNLTLSENLENFGVEYLKANTSYS